MILIPGERKKKRKKKKNLFLSSAPHLLLPECTPRTLRTIYKSLLSSLSPTLGPTVPLGGKRHLGLGF
jgi:hypothetical protein